MRAEWIRWTVAASVLAWIAPASAEEPAKTKVLPLRVSSNRLSASELDTLTDRVVEKLKKYPSLDVQKPPAADPMDLMVDAGCVDFDAACLAAIGASAQADTVLYTEVSESDGRYQVQVRLVDVKSRETRSPEGGTEVRERVPDILALAIEKVFGPEPLPESVLARVDIESNPPGADIYVDRDFVGVSPVTISLKKGQYVVRANRVGYEERMQAIRVEPGKPIAVTLALAPVQVPVPVGPVPTKEREESRQAFYETWWFWTAVGAVVIGAGTTAFVLASRSKSAATGNAQFALDPGIAPKDVTLYPSRIPGL